MTSAHFPRLRALGSCCAQHNVGLPCWLPDNVAGSPSSLMTVSIAFSSRERISVSEKRDTDAYSTSRRVFPRRGFSRRSGFLLAFQESVQFIAERRWESRRTEHRSILFSASGACSMRRQRLIHDPPSLLRVARFLKTCEFMGIDIDRVCIVGSNVRQGEKQIGCAGRCQCPNRSRVFRNRIRPLAHAAKCRTDASSPTPICEAPTPCLPAES